MNGAVVREALLSARAQPVASLMTVLIVAGMIVAVMLTTGRTVGAEQAVLGSLDSAGSRMITVRAAPEAGVTSRVLDRLSVVEGVAWTAGFSAATDVASAAVPGGKRVPFRYVTGDDLDSLGLTAPSFTDDLIFASPEALDALGLPDAAGAVMSADGTAYGLGGRFEPPAFLDPFEPLALSPRPSSEDVPLSLLVLVAETPQDVAPLSGIVRSLLGAEDTSSVKVEKSESLVRLRSLIQNQLGSFSRELVLVVLALMGALVAALVHSLVLLRRRDYGRRRALGAPRTMIVRLVLTQTGALGAVGVIVGMLTSGLLLAALGDPAPDPAFVTAVCLLTLVTSVAAAVPPAFVAASRDPIKELRVP